tara:strand:- start:5761 stop:7374 length:1614 start_codon:yes stop_codon:yes gene_type:complete
VKKLFKILLLIASVLSFSIYSQTVNQVLELRLSKAKLLASQNQKRSAYKLILKNLEQEQVHPESYYFLSEMYLNSSQVRRSFQVLYLLIKKQHKNSFLNTPLSMINFENTPSQNALLTYYKIASQFLTEAQEGVYPKIFKIKLLLLAKKYYTVVENFDFRISSTKAQLGKIFLQLNENDSAIQKLLEAKNSLSEDNKSIFKTEDLTKEEINLLIGQSLIKEGQIEAGKLYLRQVTLSDNSSNSLVDYSTSIQSLLDEDYIDLDFSYLVRSSSNILDYKDSQLTSLKTTNPDISESGVYHNRNINIIMNKNLFKKWVVKANFSYSDKVATDKLQENGDKRDLLFNFEVGVHESSTSTIKLRYEYESNYRKLNSSFTKNYSISKIIPTWIKASDTATFVIRAPFESYTFLNSSASGTGLTLGYSPFKKSQYWNPFYFVGYRSIPESNQTSSSSFLAGVSNLSILNENWNFVTSFDLENRGNELESLSYLEFNFKGLFSYRFKRFKSLRLDTGLKYISRAHADNDNLSQYELILGMGYTF